jgi:hypothetical protein
MTVIFITEFDCAVIEIHILGCMQKYLSSQSSEKRRNDIMNSLIKRLLVTFVVVLVSNVCDIYGSR